MDEEEELENTLIGQEEEAPAVNTGDALIGAGQPMFTADSNVVASVPGIENIRNPGAFNLRTEDLGNGTSQISSFPDFTGVGVSLSPFVKGALDAFKKGITQPQFGIRGFDPRQNPYQDTISAQAPPEETQTPSTSAPATQFLTPDPLVLPSETIGQTPSVNLFSAENSTQVNPMMQPLTQDQLNAIPAPLPQGVQRGSPQANFLNTLRESDNNLTEQQIAQFRQDAQDMGTTFDPVTGFSRDPFLSREASRTSTLMPGQTLSQFIRNEDAPEQRTEQFVDPQGRLRRRLTPQASVLQGFAPGVQPLAPEFTDFEQASLERQQRIGGTGSFAGDSAAREARIAERDRLPGETQTERDTRIAQSRTQRSSRGGLSQADARDLAQGMARDATEGERVRALQIQSRLGLDQFEPERELTDLEKREIESQIRAREAGIAVQERKADFQPRLIDVGGERAMELSPGYFQRIPKDTPEKTGLQKTLENLQSDLDSGRLTQEEYDIATKNAIDLYIGREKPKGQTTEDEFQNIIAGAEAGGVPKVDATDAPQVATGRGQARRGRPVETDGSTPPSPVRVNSPAEYDALSIGTPYIDSQGTEAVKK